MRRRYWVLFCLAAILGAQIGPASIADEPKTVRLGMLATMFRSRKTAAFAALRGPFSAVVESQTGLHYKLMLLPSVDEMRRQLADGTLELGLCHGFEFAWMKQAEPRIRPLMIVAPAHVPLKGFVVVTESSSAAALADLRGTKVAIPNGIHQTARLFAERQCHCANANSQDFFREISTPVNSETALHNLYEGNVQAAIVDTSGLKCFEERYPARFKRLRILIESAPFPMSVVAIRDGGIELSVLRQFQAGMLNAKSSIVGRQLLGLMQSGGFEPIPADFDRQLEDVLREFPPPDEQK